MNKISKKITVYLLQVFLSRAFRADIYLFPIVKSGGTCAMLNFEISVYVFKVRQG